MIRGTTALIAHIGWPTHAFKAPMIYNPYFEQRRHRCRGRADGVQGRELPGVPARHFLAREHPRSADHDAAQGNDARLARRGLGHGADRRRLQRGAAHGGRAPTGRHVRRRRLRARLAPQGLPDRRCEGSGRRQRRRGLGDRRIAGGRRRGRDRPVRQPRRIGGGTRRAPATALSAAAGQYRFERSRRLRAGGQRDAAGDERRRSAAAGCLPHCSDSASSARW